MGKEVRGEIPTVRTETRLAGAGSIGVGGVVHLPSSQVASGPPHGPSPPQAGANRYAVWLAALTAVGRLVGRQVGASVFVFAYAVTGRVSLRSLSTPSQARETRLRCLRSYAEAG